MLWESGWVLDILIVVVVIPSWGIMMGSIYDERCRGERNFGSTSSGVTLLELFERYLHFGPFGLDSLALLILEQYFQ